MAEKKGYDWSTLWKTEDWVAVWLGFLVIALILIFNNWKVIDLTKVPANHKWATDSQIASRVAKWNETADPLIKDAEAREELGTVTRLQMLKEALAKGDRKEIETAAGRVERIGGIPGAL